MYYQGPDSEQGPGLQIGNQLMQATEKPEHSMTSEISKIRMGNGRG